jgi:hypothetical protein
MAFFRPEWAVFSFFRYGAPTVPPIPPQETASMSNVLFYALLLLGTLLFLGALWYNRRRGK